MNDAYGLSVSFWSRVRSKYIGHNIYTGRRSNLLSKPTPIYGPNMVWIIHTQEVTSVGYHNQLLKLIYCLSQKVRYAFKIFDPVINGFSTNEVKSHLASMITQSLHLI